MQIEKVKNALVKVSCLFLFFFSVYTGLFGPFAAVPQGTLHLVPIFIVFYFTQPSGLFRNSFIEKVYSLSFMTAGIVSSIYFAAKWVDILTYFKVGTRELLMGILLTASILEGCRRSVAKPLFYVAVAAIAYAVFGHHLPGILGHGPIKWQHITRFLAVGSNGIYGLPLWVGATYFILFMYFVAFLTVSGAHEKFMNFAMACVGHLTGGLGKVAVVASSLMGMTCGSAVANVLGTGSITIPLMKKYGYAAHVAGAIEATASTGGIIMPPLMGVAAFVMAEVMGVSYFDVMVAGFLPAILYYLAVFLQVDARSRKEGLLGLPKEQLPSKKQALKEVAPLTIAVLVLVYMLGIRMGISMAVARSLIVLIAIIIVFRPQGGFGFRKFVDAVVDGAKSMAPLTFALCVCAVVMGCLNMTGLSAKVSHLIELASGGYLLPALIYTGIAAIILGMGMPSVAVYLILATLTVPLLMKMGVERFSAHFFVFYFSAIAPISPPIMMATYAAVGIAKADPWKTGFYALRLAIAGFIVPFMFAYNPALLGRAPLWYTITYFLVALLGVSLTAVAFEGMCLKWRLALGKRLACGMAGLLAFAVASRVFL